MKPRISFLRCLRDPRFLGGPQGSPQALADPAFQPWHCIAKLIDGTPLDPHEIKFALAQTGRTTLPPGELRRLYLFVGCRGGKSRFLAAFACWIACFAADWKSIPAAGEPGVCFLLSRSKAQAAILLDYINGFVSAPNLAPEVTRRTTDRVEFRSGATIQILAADARTLRGRTAIAILGDEASYWKISGESESSAEEVLASCGDAVDDQHPRRRLFAAFKHGRLEARPHV